MNFTDREITKEEYIKICEDFRKIEVEYGITELKAKRLNVVIDEEGAVAGFASGLINYKWLYLTDLWISEKLRGQGLGSRILEMLEDSAKNQGVRHVYTWTTAYNSNEIFYEKQGYRQCLVFEDFFGVNGGHHICLRKDL